MHKATTTLPGPSLGPLLGPNDHPAVVTVNSAGKSPILLVCDHAAAAIPQSLGDLGVAEADRLRHIGWDIGAAEVTRALAVLLDAPALLSGYSRLVLDVNRFPDHPTLIPEESDGTVVPGNQGLSDAQRQARLDALFHPYHAAIRERLAAFATAGVVPALISIHSFTPAMSGVPRPWQAGVLWNRDPRIAVPLIRALSALPGMTIGDNQPYSARGPLGYTLRTHADNVGIPAVMLEIRQDEISSAIGAQRWAELLAKALRPLLADTSCRERRVYPA